MRLLKQQILFALADGVDFLHPTEQFKPMAYKGLYWRMEGYKQASVRGAVNELIRNGFVSKFSRSRLVELRLTRVGREQLVSFFPLTYYGRLVASGRGGGGNSLGVGSGTLGVGGKQWDKTWRVVIFGGGNLWSKKRGDLRGDLGIGSGLVRGNRTLTAVHKSPNQLQQLQQLQRSRQLRQSHQSRQLRQILGKLGFMPLYKGVYVSPFSVTRELTRILAERQWLGVVRLLETKRFVVGDDRSFAAETWKLDTIYNRYQNLITHSRRVLYEVLRVKRLTDQLKNDYRQSLFQWFEVLKMDPGLPKTLLPADWPPLEASGLLGKMAHEVRELERITK